MIIFVNQCIERDTNFCKMLSLHKLSPAETNLQLFATCCLDSYKKKLIELQNLSSGTRSVLSEIAIAFYLNFTNF